MFQPAPSVIEVATHTGRAESASQAALEQPLVTPAGASSLEEMERHHIELVLAQTGWVVEGPEGAAKILNLHPSTLRSRMQKLGIKRRSSSSNARV